MDLQQFIAEFQDYLAPKLDTYDQAIYLYIFRHSRLIGLDEVTGSNRLEVEWHAETLHTSNSDHLKRKKHFLIGPRQSATTRHSG
jgi:hypothetical protein